MLRYVGNKLCIFERNIRHITEKWFYSAKPRVILKSLPMFTPKCKAPISIEDNSCVVYTFECCCKNIYIGQKYRNFKARI